MNWETMTVGVARVSPGAMPIYDSLYSPTTTDDATRWGARNNLLTFVHRTPVFDGCFHPQGRLTATIVASQAYIDGRLCYWMVVELCNGDPEFPVPTDDTLASYEVAFTGCIALPIYGYSLGGELNITPSGEATVWKFPKWRHGLTGQMGTTFPTHTRRAMRFLVVQPDITETVQMAQAWAAERILDSDFDNALHSDPAEAHTEEEPFFEIPLKRSNSFPATVPERAFVWSQADPLSLWGFRQNPGGSGDDGEFGSDPYPELRAESYVSGAINLDRRLMGYSGHQPVHLYDRRYVRTPSEEAWKFTGSLSDHSRNRKGLPHRSDPKLSEYKKGVVALPDTIEHEADPVLHLAWYTGDPYLCEQAVDIGYRLLNSIHTSEFGIYNGGYDFPLCPIPRCHRMMIALIQAQMVCERWGKTFPHAERAAWLFKEFIAEKVNEIYNSDWRQRGYADWAIFEREDGKVNGKMGIAVWQGGFPIQVYDWVVKNFQKLPVKLAARTMLQEWTKLVLSSWFTPATAGGRWKSAKLVEAKPLNSPNWPYEAETWEPHESLEGIENWPYAGLQLALGYHADLFTTAEKDKMRAVIANIEKYSPVIVNGRWGNVAVPPQDPI